MTEQGEIQPTPEEKLLRAIFGEDIRSPEDALDNSVSLETIGDLLAPEWSVARDDDPPPYATAELTDYVRAALSPLSEIEQRVLSLRFGLEDRIERKPKGVAPEVGRAVSTVRKIERRAFRKLRSQGESAKTRQYLTELREFIE